MTVDGLFILATYVMSCVALSISLYVLYSNIEQKTDKKKPNNARDHYHKKANEPVIKKGHWD